MASMIRPLDIEQALRWMARDELPKRSASPTSPWEAVLGYGERGGRAIDGASPDPGFPALMGEPHPDALALERAVAGLREMRFSLAPGEPLAPDLAGFRLDEHDALARVAGSVVGLVLCHARLGSRPPWEARTVPGPARQEKGQVSVMVDHIVPRPSRWEEVETRGRDGTARTVMQPAAWVETRHPVPTAKRGGRSPYEDGAYCPLAWDEPPEAVLHERAGYAVWWAALDYMVETVRLETIRLTGPEAPQRPWTGETEPARRVRTREEAA